MNHRKRSRYVVGGLPFKTSEPVKITVNPGSFTDSIPYKMPFVEGIAMEPSEFAPSAYETIISPQGRQFFIEKLGLDDPSIYKTPISPLDSPFFIEKIDPPSIHYIETDTLVVSSFSSTSLATSFSYTLTTRGDVDLMVVSSWVFDARSNPSGDHYQHRGIRPDGQCYLARYDDDCEGTHIHLKLPLDHKITEEDIKAVFPYLERVMKNILRILFSRRKNVTKAN